MRFDDYWGASKEQPLLPDEADSAIRPGVLRDVWYGRRSVGEMFGMWWFLVGGTFLGLVVGGIFGQIAEGLRSDFPIYLYVALIMPYNIWFTVGTWRSCIRRGGGV